MNMTNLRIFNSPNYKPVWRALPAQPEWQRISTDINFECNFASLYKLSWVFDYEYSESDLFFAFAPPYSYGDIMQSLSFFETNCPKDSYFFRETIVKSLDNRAVELVTISKKENFYEDQEKRQPMLFPGSKPRCPRGKKPVVFVSARVHPGETPASYALEAFLRSLLSTDKRSSFLRKNFVFKIVPVLNPDGVFRGHYRVDQNGINLNRCYTNPSSVDHPSVFAVKSYFEYLYNLPESICMYMDFHAHASRRASFIFGNHIQGEAQINNELFAKLVDMNSPFFEYGECDFSERGMYAKDPKDHASKEGSGRVALYRSTGIPCSYTVECSYYIPKVFHSVTPLVNLKSGRKQTEASMLAYPKSRVYNKEMFDSIGESLAYSILDYYRINPISRVLSSEFKTLDKVKEYIVLCLEKRKTKPTKTPSRRELSRGYKRNPERPPMFPKVPNRVPQKVNKVTPVLSERTPGSATKPKVSGTLLKRPKTMLTKSKYK